MSLFTKVNESWTIWLENLSRTSCNTETKNVDTFDCGVLVLDKIGLNGMSFLWVLGRPYNLGRCEPIGLVNS